MAVVAVVTAAWVAIGALGVTLMRRRGHDTFAWAIVFMFLGPLGWPVALSADRQPAPQPDRPVHDGGLNVLVACDGSPHARAALDAAVELVGGNMTSLTLATVVDREAATTVRGRDTVADAERRLDELKTAVAPHVLVPIDTLVLYGEPASAIERFAVDHGYELIVAGACGTGRTSGPRGAVAAALAAHAPVPVLVGPIS